MTLGSHKDCRHSFTFFDKEITCACECHTNPEYFVKDNNAKTKQRRTRKTNQQQITISEPASVPTKKATKPRQVSGTGTNKTSKGAK